MCPKLLMLLFFSTIFTLSAQDKAPILTVNGNQYYCPLSKIPITTNSDITDPDSMGTSGVYIQISTGYNKGSEVLSLDGNHPNLKASWNVVQAKLSITSISGAIVPYVELIAAINDVVFESTDPAISGERSFSISLGDINYLPTTGHYYEYVSEIGITWSNAKTAAEASTYFGLQGYLATITSLEEAKLTGEQSEGAGWIGGSDAAREGEWKWVTGPEAGTVFWNGSINGSSPNFAYWNTGEPNQAGDEDYAHITDNSIGIPGAWNDLSNAGNTNGVYQPKGYIIEYGGMPDDPILTISGSTRISIPSIDKVTGDTICGSGSGVVSAIASEGDINWYDAPVNGVLLHTGDTFTTTILNVTTSFYAQVSVNGCVSGELIEVIATVNPLPIVNNMVTYRNCDVDGNLDGFTDFNLEEVNALISTENVSISYHFSLLEAENNDNPIDPTSFNNATAAVLFARIQNNFGCFSTATIQLFTSTTAIPTSFEALLEGCDDDGLEDGFNSFNLIDADAEFLALFPANQSLSVHYYKSLQEGLLEQNEITAPYTNETKTEQTLFVRVESSVNGHCFGIGPHLKLKVNPLPKFITEKEVFICNGSVVSLNVFNAQENYSYKWEGPNNNFLGSDENIEVSEPGQYKVTATSDKGCLKTQTITVKASSVASISQTDIVVIDARNNNSIHISNPENLGIGAYEFSLDNEFGPYQDQPEFTGVTPGMHLLYVRDKNGCGTVHISVAVIGFPSFFSPNNDNNNETWQVIGLHSKFFTNASLFVFDRYGKLLTQLDPFGSGWHGTYLGSPLPASDYWFKMNFTDLEGTAHNRSGHFSLVR